jgi:hypothetical protein
MPLLKSFVFGSKEYHTRPLSVISTSLPFKEGHAGVSAATAAFIITRLRKDHAAIRLTLIFINHLIKDGEKNPNAGDLFFNTLTNTRPFYKKDRTPAEKIQLFILSAATI